MWKEDLDRRFPMMMRALYMLAALALVLLGFKVAFNYLLPFVAAFLMAAAMEPFVRFLVKRRLPRGPAVAIAMVVYFGIVFFLGFLAIDRLVAEVVHFSRNMPDYGRAFSVILNDLLDAGKKFYLRLPKEAVGPLQEQVQSLAVQLSSALTSLAGSIIRVFAALPELLMFAMFTVVATFFASKDRALYNDFISKRLPPATYDRLARLKHSLGHSLVGFLRAQLMLMTLTFTQCFIGLSLIGIRYALVISLFTAIVDILPVLGTGTVLIPWALTTLIMGKTATGLGLLALYLVIMVIRYVVEPKIIGSQLGLHPLTALVGMFVGLKTMGVAGLILGPAIIVTVQALMKSGLIPQLKE